MPGSIAVVLAFAAEQKSIEPLVLADGGKAIEAAGEQLVNVALMAHIKDKLVFWSFKNTMQRDRQFDHAKIGSEVAAGIRKNLDEFVADLLSELRKRTGVEFFQVRRRLNRLKKRSSWCVRGREVQVSLSGSKSSSFVFPRASRAMI